MGQRAQESVCVCLEQVGSSFASAPHLTFPLTLPPALMGSPREFGMCIFLPHPTPRDRPLLLLSWLRSGASYLSIPWMKGSGPKGWVCLKIKADYKALTLYLQKEQPFPFSWGQHVPPLCSGLALVAVLLLRFPLKIHPQNFLQLLTDPTQSCRTMYKTSEHFTPHSNYQIKLSQFYNFFFFLILSYLHTEHIFAFLPPSFSWTLIKNFLKYVFPQLHFISSVFIGIPFFKMDLFSKRDVRVDGWG